MTEEGTQHPRPGSGGGASGALTAQENKVLPFSVYLCDFLNRQGGPSVGKKDLPFINNISLNLLNRYPFHFFSSLKATSKCWFLTD